MNEDKIKELRAHAGKLVAEGKPLSGVFEFWRDDFKHWQKTIAANAVPFFDDGNEWRIAQPKKQLIDWSNPYFKGCATNYGELYITCVESAICEAALRSATAFKDLHLATPANDDSNWQYFRSTPENDAKLRELAKMVKVEVRFASDYTSSYKNQDFDAGLIFLHTISNFRITGECQEGWTDKPEEAQS